MKVMVTCPPMLGMMDEFREGFDVKGVQVYCPDVVQTLSEDTLAQLAPQYDGWIIGDDPVSRRVLEAGTNGKLKAAVKWGIGTDNIDFSAAEEFGLKIENTPNMFGSEVADVAICYMIGLGRELFWIDREVRAGNWPKPQGQSLSGKTVGLIGYGDIGKNVANRLAALSMNVIIFDPAFDAEADPRVMIWPRRVAECDYLIFTCALTALNRHMLSADVLKDTKRGVRVINVARGPLIDEKSLLSSLKTDQVHSVALDVMEIEPLPMSSELRSYPKCIFGSHNSSNTLEAVRATSRKAMAKLFEGLEIV